MNLQEFIDTLNRLGRDKVPFLFIADFELESPLVLTFDKINPDEILFDIDGYSNAIDQRVSKPIGIKKHPIAFEEYESKFRRVMSHLNRGDSYLTNLTIRTKIDLDAELIDVFHTSSAKYKLWMKDLFVVFSPEAFIKIKDGIIYSFPMKGTIDASLPDAEKRILEDQKELAEHVTIVDLIRNDLSIVASNVRVNRFRYIDKVKTNHKNLLQVSSEIIGKLSANYREHIGDILASILPAGSVSGAPKQKTLEAIREAEGEKRKFYSGVFGYFDGKNLESAVMIRFIEKTADGYYYRSGGGITSQSTAESEYQEAIDKIYVPIN